MLIHFIHHLVTEYEKGTGDVVDLLTSARIHILVSMNPDGFELANNDEHARSDCVGITGRYDVCIHIFAF